MKRLTMCLLTHPMTDEPTGSLNDKSDRGQQQAVVIDDDAGASAMFPLQDFRYVISS